MKSIHLSKLVFLSAFLCVINLHAQSWTSTPPVQYPMPASVWEFEKFGGATVSEYRGLANISIPLYKVEVNGVSLPLTLDYYNGGIRVSEIPGMVGTGWSLNIPTITQQIKDKNDYNYHTTHQKLPPYQGNPVIPVAGIYTDANGQWNTDLNAFYDVGTVSQLPLYRYVTIYKVIDYNGYYNTNASTAGKYQEMFEPNSKIVDTEPDIFKVALNGVELKFCRTMSAASDSSQPFELLPLQMINKRDEYKVEVIPGTPNQANNWLAISGIKITDPSGIQYIFAKIDQGSGEDFINYRLTKIITLTNEEATLTYSAPVSFTEPSKLNFTYYRRNGNTLTEDISQGVNGVYTAFDDNSCGHLGGGSTQLNEVGCAELPNITYDQSFLQSIVTPTQKIVFTYSNRLDFTALKKLDAFEVQNIFGTKTKKILFDYDYFSQSGNNKRLKLLSVQEEGREPYSFFYNPITLPAYNAYSIDYWGFYNGKTTNTSLKLNLAQLGYPQYTENMSNDFSSNLAYAKACSLEKIVYPTKGYTKYEYGLHEFDNLIYSAPSGVVINTGGGLRVQSVRDFDSDETLLKHTSYTYSDGKCNAKRVLAKESYEINGRTFTPAQQYKHILKYTTPCIVTNFNNYVNQNIDSGGDYIGYGKVTIKEEGPYNNGRIEKVFSNTEEACINPYGNFFPQAVNYKNKDIGENGNILQEVVYNDQGNKVTQTDYTYANINGFGNRYAMAKQSAGIVLNLYSYSIPGPAQGEAVPSYYIYPRTLATFYPIYSKTSLLTKKISTSYFPSGVTSLTTTFSYDLNNLPVSTITKEADLSVISSESTVYATNPGHTALNILDLPTYTTVKDKDVLTTTYHTYKSPSSTLPDVMQSYLNNDTTLSKNFHYDLYDDRNNLIQYHQENDINYVIIWGYNKLLPIAKIANATYSQIQSYAAAIQSSSNTDNEQQLLLDLQSFRNTINSIYPQSPVTTYTHKPLIGISTITDVNGNRSTFQYDSSGRLVSVRDMENNIVSENEYHFKP